MSMQSCSVNGLPRPLKIGSKLLRNRERFHDCWVRSSLSEVEIFPAKSPADGVRSIALLVMLLVVYVSAGQTQAAEPWPTPREGDYLAKDFHFKDGSVLPELRLHYRVLGQPHRNHSGQVDNAVLILHGTGGAGTQFLGPRFAGVLFVPGGLLDGAKYFIILPDDIGHGKSSKPSDGMHALPEI
jgi:hypothetical protein